MTDLSQKAFRVRFPVDLVLLDLFFGGENRGAEIFKAIIRTHPEWPVFLLTGRADNETRIEMEFGPKQRSPGTVR